MLFREVTLYITFEILRKKRTCRKDYRDDGERVSSLMDIA